MGKSPCCSKEGLNRGAWTAHEDKILREYIRVHGEGRWRNVPKKAGLKRCGKSCRLRWLNYLRPDIKRGNISSDEEDLIIRLHNLLGNRWSLIAGRLPGRTDNEIKNYWNTNLGKKVKDRHQITTTSSQLTPKVKVTTPSPSPSPSPSPPKLDTHVVRTKATKCSTVLLKNSSLPHSSMQLKNKSKAEDASVSNNSISNRMDNDMEGSDNNGFLSFINEEEKELISTDLLKDFKPGDVCLSDLLNSDLSNYYMCDFSYNEDLLSPCSDPLPLFSDEILKDWTQSNSGSEINAPNNLCSFS